MYINHLKVISELEMFYQDPHIEMLRKHTEDLVEQLRAYEEFYNILAKNDISEIPIENKEGPVDNAEEERDERTAST